MFGQLPELCWPGAGFDDAGGVVVFGVVSDVWACATAVAPPAAAAMMAPATRTCFSLRVMLHLPSHSMGWVV
jgi:hypothetical protein